YRRRLPQVSWNQVCSMNLVAELLCLSACLTTLTCDRVYVHPFNLFSFKKGTCEELENQVPERKKTFVPVSIESQTTPSYEDDPNKEKLEAQRRSGQGQQALSYLKESVHFLGMRFYSTLREARQGQNLLLSPTSLYGSLVSFYLGASNQTAANLQGLLGFAPPSGDPDCISRVFGQEVFSMLRMIENLVKSREEELQFSKMLCVFSAPGVPLSLRFVQDLLPSADALYARAVDFTNPSEAVKQVNTFMEAKSNGQKLISSFSICFSVDVKQASRLEEAQEFWVDSDTKVMVPMLSFVGTFNYKTDASGTFSVIEVPISKTMLLVLLQPINDSDVELPLQSLPWLQQLSPREIKLTLPELTIEGSSDLQELLDNMELPTLLGKGADLSRISDANLTVGKVINKAFFKLTSDGTGQPEDPTAQKEDTVFLDITLNKPFLLAVFEETTRAMLFLGRVTNPLQGL
uniref:Angiotensinogen n=1 Tax=Melopsittacus undulatus TaxID=13146 RepID=A0A8C6IRC0_MELUD